MENKEYYEELLERSINLYVKGTLNQYGLEERTSLEIVSNLTGIAPEKLEKLKQERYESIRSTFEKSNDTVINIATR